MKNVKYIASIFAYTLLLASLNALASTHRWDQEDIPQRGWVAIGIVDREAMDGSCDFCGHRIRYEHNLEHPDYGDQLIAGSSCAPKLAEEYVEQIAADRRRAERAARKKARIARQIAERERLNAERLARQIATRKTEWIDGYWRVNNKGTHSKRVNDSWINIFQKNTGWKYVYNSEFSDFFASLRAAKQAAYTQYIE